MGMKFFLLGEENIAIKLKIKIPIAESIPLASPGID